VRHVKGSKHTAVDGLSRRPRTISDDLDELYEEEIDDWITIQLDYLSIAPILVGEGNNHVTDHVTRVSEVKGIPLTAWCLTSKATTSLETLLGEPGANNPLKDDYSKDS
jgi:hypothetical protein